MGDLLYGHPSRQPTQYITYGNTGTYYTGLTGPSALPYLDAWKS